LSSPDLKHDLHPVPPPTGDLAGDLTGDLAGLGALREAAGAFAGASQRLDCSYLEVGSLLWNLLVAIARCEDSGVPVGVVNSALAEVRAACLGAPFVRWAQEWPRGYPGDFEMIERIVSQSNQAAAGTFGWYLEGMMLNSPITQQHRNKLAHQSGLIVAALAAARPGAARILMIAAGGAADLRQVPASLVGPDDRFVLNDVDPAALTLAGDLLGPLRAQCQMEPGNIFKQIDRLAGLGPYDLVLAGGLFDYLPDRPAARLVEAVLTRLCRPGGRFYFSNIATGNPFAGMMKHLADWSLIERDEAALRDLVRGAGKGRTDEISVRREGTGLTLLTEVRLTMT
jgi:extracellular factor (EF) 3-hydroxypalmitic acid methyl ester biosynthesis protein